MLEFVDKLVQSVTVDRYLMNSGVGSASVKIAEIAVMPQKREMEIMKQTYQAFSDGARSASTPKSTTYAATRAH